MLLSVIIINHSQRLRRIIHAIRRGSYPDKRPREFFRAQAQITMHRWATTCHVKLDLPWHTAGTHEANTVAARGTLIRLVKPPKMFLRGHLTLCALQAENMHPGIQVLWLRGQQHHYLRPQWANKAQGCLHYCSSSSLRKEPINICWVQ